MQGLQVDINHLNPVVRYKFISNGSIYSGNFNRSFLSQDTPPERYIVLMKLMKYPKVV